MTSEQRRADGAAKKSLIQRPVNGRLSLPFQYCIGFGKVLVALKRVAGEWGRVRCCQYRMFFEVNQPFFALREFAPEQKHQPGFLLGQLMNDRVGEGLPADLLVGGGLPGLYGQDGIEQ